MFEVFFELVFEFFGELLLQLLFELFGSAFKTGWHKLRGRDQAISTAQETIWSVLTGIVAGAVTVLLFPVLAIRLPWLQVLNLALAPLVAGLLVERVRAWRASRREFNWPVFAYAALFGLLFVLTRWLFGR